MGVSAHCACHHDGQDTESCDTVGYSPSSFLQMPIGLVSGRMTGAKERHDGYLRAWLTRPEFRAALHRNDTIDCDDGEPVKKAACR